MPLPLPFEACLKCVFVLVVIMSEEDTVVAARQRSPLTWKFPEKAFPCSCQRNPGNKALVLISAEEYNEGSKKDRRRSLTEVLIPCPK